MKYVVFIAVTIALLGAFALWARRAPRREVIRAGLCAVFGAVVGYVGSNLLDR